MNSPELLEKPTLSKMNRLFPTVMNAFASLPPSFFSLGNQIAIDVIVAAAAVFVAFHLRFDFTVRAEFVPTMWFWICVMPAVRVVGILACGSYKRIWRYFNMSDATLLFVGALPATFILLVLRLTWNHQTWIARVPLSVIILEMGVFLAFATATRSLRRATYQYSTLHNSQRVRAILIGTEATLPGALRQVTGDASIRIIALLAPEEHLHGLRIGGHLVTAAPSALENVLLSQGADLVLIADSTLASLSDSVSTATEFGVDVRLLPSAQNVLKGQVRVATPLEADMAFQDRKLVEMTDPAVGEGFSGRCVLVTGAGGSIGSEISRQVASLPVSKLILLDRDENSIFERTVELRKTYPQLKLISLVGDIRDKDFISLIFDQHKVQVVLHAAAYKHVPVMEENCSEAVLNNVMGTRVLIDCAIAARSERFLMISTDKAVKPSSVMGATKRLAEMLVQHRAAFMSEHHVEFACVRFGNVVGSRGSVVPIFLRQIEAGLPLTITDEEMTRYFMTIPEAVQLVLKASTIGSQGAIFMLDMGDPIKILSLAKKLIEMSGLRPGKDIDIQIVGRRPGEKLHEQLWTQGSTVAPTVFAKVFRVAPETLPADFTHLVATLEKTALQRCDQTSYEALMAMPMEFTEVEKSMAATTKA